MAALPQIARREDTRPPWEIAPTRADLLPLLINENNEQELMESLRVYGEVQMARVAALGLQLIGLWGQGNLDDPWPQQVGHHEARHEDPTGWRIVAEEIYSRNAFGAPLVRVIRATWTAPGGADVRFTWDATTNTFVRA